MGVTLSANHRAGPGDQHDVSICSQQRQTRREPSAKGASHPALLRGRRLCGRMRVTRGVPLALHRSRTLLTAQTSVVGKSEMRWLCIREPWSASGSRIVRGRRVCVAEGGLVRAMRASVVGFLAREERSVGGHKMNTGEGSQCNGFLRLTKACGRPVAASVKA